MARSKAWKSNERDIARFFGYTGRTSLSGGNSKSGTTADNHPDRHPDLPKGKLYIEHKRRKEHALANLFLKELPKAEKEKKTLVLALTHNRTHFLFMRAKDLLAIAKERKETLKVDMQDVIKPKRLNIRKVRKLKLH